LECYFQRVRQSQSPNGAAIDTNDG
jgi:hypothetical protein